MIAGGVWAYGSLNDSAGAEIAIEVAAHQTRLTQIRFAVASLGFAEQSPLPCRCPGHGPEHSTIRRIGRLDMPSTPVSSSAFTASPGATWLDALGETLTVVPIFPPRPT
jgi:hypothetical protein